MLKLIPISTELPAQIKKSLKKTFSIKKVEKLADGSSVARVRFIRIEQGERMVAVHETKEETRQRTVEGKPLSYTVSVPVTRRVSQPYSVEVPFEKDVPVPKGKDVEAAVEAFMTELKQN